MDKVEKLRIAVRYVIEVENIRFTQAAQEIGIHYATFRKFLNDDGKQKLYEPTTIKIARWLQIYLHEWKDFLAEG